MDDRDVAEMTLLMTAANLVANLDILKVSQQLLDVNERHLKAFLEYKEMMEKEYGMDKCGR